jgi:hypothetical protein
MLSSIFGNCNLTRYIKLWEGLKQEYEADLENLREMLDLIKYSCCDEPVQSKQPH